MGTSYGINISDRELSGPCDGYPRDIIPQILEMIEVIETDFKQFKIDMYDERWGDSSKSDWGADGEFRYDVFKIDGINTIKISHYGTNIVSLNSKTFNPETMGVSKFENLFDAIQYGNMSDVEDICNEYNHSILIS